MSRLVIMGSGETAPVMVKAHREVMSAAGVSTTAPAVVLDTPFGFQRNADDLVRRTRDYFAQSVGTPVEVVSWRRADAPLAQREQALALLGRAAWAFAGPGSPTYALRQWRGTPLPEALVDVVTRGGTLVTGSAAACTVGTHAVPVYEIYKVGADPSWEPGLDLFGRLTGVRAVLIPHYDNAEGGNHDTRFCYLGEERLAYLERLLPPEVGVLGIDEHTALDVDLTTRATRVLGNGVVTVRRRGVSVTFPAGSAPHLDDLAALLRGERVGPGPSSAAAGVTATGVAPVDGVAGPTGGGPSLRADAQAARAAFETALAARDAIGCVTAVLGLEEAIVAWSADTLQSDAVGHARRVLRALVVRLGDLAQDGARDPRELAGPFVDVLLEVRGRARAAKDWPLSDLIRDGLDRAGVEVRDTPDGPAWALRPGDRVAPSDAAG